MTLLRLGSCRLWVLDLKKNYKSENFEKKNLSPKSVKIFLSPKKIVTFFLSLEIQSSPKRIEKKLPWRPHDSACDNACQPR